MQVWDKVWDKCRILVHSMIFNVLYSRLGEANFVAGAIHVIFINIRSFRKNPLAVCLLNGGFAQARCHSAARPDLVFALAVNLLEILRKAVK